MLTFKQTIIIAVITTGATMIANIIFQWLKDNFDKFGETKRFVRDYSYKQLENLYLKLYAIICQSEYLRCFHDLEKDFNKVPFLEIRTKRYSKTIDMGSGDVKIEEFTVEDAVGRFNKSQIAQLIITNAVYSSEKLLKLSVAYRYVHEHYEDNTIEKDLLEKYKKQEVYLIAKIVNLVIVETNKKLKTCNMNYNAIESKKGIIDNEIFGIKNDTEAKKNS